MASGNTFRGKIRTSILDSTPWWPEEKHAPEGAPNVLYIVLDDTGYSQLDCYGSLIPTPSIDALALDGIRYTDFNVCALCSPTRACLMTGYNNQTVGMSFLAANDMGYPNLAGRIDRRFGFLPEVLKANGYATFCVGKWHITNESEASGAGPFDNWPLGRGFERYYGFLNGATNQFYPELVRDNSMIDPPASPEQGYHLSADLIDNAIKFIGTEKSVYPDKPFFCYLALGAMHSPHQAPAEYIDRFSGKFDMGYEEYRCLVFKKQKEAGLLPDSAELTEINDWVRPWDGLDAWEKKVFARYMEAFAGFLSYTDEQIGRLIGFLKQIGQYDNTMIVLMSDNGAAAGGGKNGCLSEHYHIHTGKEPPLVNEEEYSRIGTADACNLYPTGWAWAGNTPMKLYKHWVHNGGVKVPFSITWPARIKDRGGLRRQFHYVTDLFPTVLESCGIPMPEYVNGFKQAPRPGVSMVYSFDHPETPSRRKTQYFEMAGNRAIYSEGWKAVADHVNSPSFDDDKWELYHVDGDFCENHDLSEAYPDKLEELKALWWSEAEKNGVFPMLESHLSTRNGVQWGAQVKLRPVPSRQHFTYYAGMEINAPVPRLKNKPFRLEAEVNYRAGDEGVLFACGFNIGGYALYVENARLCFHYNFVDSEYTNVESSVPLPEGRHAFGFEFKLIRPGEGIGTITIDGRAAGKEVRFTDSGFMVKSCIGVGRYSASAVKREHGGRPNHFAYSGSYSRVDFYIGAPENHEDHLDALTLHRENE